MIVLSAEKSDCNKTENDLRSAALVANLCDLLGWDAQIIPSTGSWRGVKEQCYLIKLLKHVSNENINYYAKMLKSLAMQYDQDIIGMIDTRSMRVACIDLRTERYTVAELIINKEKPKNDSWTIVNGYYYTPGMDITKKVELMGIISEEVNND